MASTCAVCLDDTNKSTRFPTECPYCHTVVCRTCLQIYLLNDINDTPRCVNNDCGHGWEREFLDDSLTRTFRLFTFKEHREKVLIDREKSRLPATQAQAADYKQAKDVLRSTNKELAELHVKMTKLKQKMTHVENVRANAHTVIHTYGRTPLRTEAENQVVTTEAAPKKERAEFVRPCPAPDCKGFLSTAWKCGMCDQYTCPHCHDLKGLNRDVEHTCDPDKVATAALIERESRGCPKCGARICKIEGCDQMWCTNCNTGFNWRTGKIADGPIHNPHYFEYLRRTGRAPTANGGAGGGGAVGAAAACGVADTAIMRALDPDAYDEFGYRRRTRNYLTPVPTTPPHPDAPYLMEAWRLMNEANDPWHHRHTREPDTNELYRVLRVRFMNKEISEEEWKTDLQRIEKDANFIRARNQVRDLFVQATRDLISQVTRPGADFAEIRKQVEELIKYVNESYEKVSKRFGRKTPTLAVRVK